MFRASAARSRWLPVERRRRSGAGLGAARRGDLDRAEFGIGTSHAAGAEQCRTGGGRLVSAMRGVGSGPVVVLKSSFSTSSFMEEGEGTMSRASGREAGRR